MPSWPLGSRGLLVAGAHRRSRATKVLGEGENKESRHGCPYPQDPASTETRGEPCLHLPWNRRCRKLKTGQRHICVAICLTLTPQHALGLTCTLAECSHLKMCLFPPKPCSPLLWRSPPVLHALAEGAALIAHGLPMGLTLCNPDHLCMAV